MTGFKEFLEAFDSKLRSPVLGSAFLSFIAINWKALYVVIFSSTSFANKFEYFDKNTNPLTLLVYPLILGFLIVLIGPWLKLLGAHLSKSPISKLKTLQANAAHETILHKQKLASERKRLLGTEEEALIEQAKRDQIIQDQIFDAKIKDDLEKQISELRRNFEENSAKYSSKQLQDLEDKLTLLEANSLVNASEISEIKLTQEKTAQIDVINQRISRYREQLEENSLAEFERIDLEEKIIKELKNIETIKNGFPYPPKDLDKEIPF